MSCLNFTLDSDPRRIEANALAGCIHCIFLTINFDNGLSALCPISIFRIQIAIWIQQRSISINGIIVPVLRRNWNETRKKCWIKPVFRFDSTIFSIVFCFSFLFIIIILVFFVLSASGKSCKILCCFVHYVRPSRSPSLHFFSSFWFDLGFGMNEESIRIGLACPNMRYDASERWYFGSRSPLPLATC